MTRPALAAVLVLGGCAEDPPGALDPDVVSALATQVGDARGLGPSGVYAIELRPESCGCSDLDTALSPLTLCQRGVLNPLDDPWVPTTFDIVVSDGVIDIASDAATPNPIGPLDADGTFQAGAVTRLISFATTGYQVTRAEGSLEPVGDSDYTIEGEIQLRLIGRVELRGVEDVVTGVEDIDCVESLSFSGDRYIVR